MSDLQLFRKRFESGDPLRDWYSEIELGEMLLEADEKIAKLREAALFSLVYTGAFSREQAEALLDVAIQPVPEETA